MTKRKEKQSAAPLTEAAAGSFEARREAVHRVLRSQSPDGPYPHIVALFQSPDQVVVERDGSLTRYDYAVSANGATLTNPVLVEETFSTVEMTAAEAAADTLEIIAEAKDASKPGEAGRWPVRAIRAGLSRNGHYYPPAVLREAAPLFEGARVLARADEDHVAGRNKSVSALIGRLTEARFVETQGGGGEVRAVMELIEPDGVEGRKLAEAHARGMTNLFGLSIVAAGRARVTRAGSRVVRLVESIEQVESVDLVLYPSAGGAILDDFKEAVRGRAAAEEKDMKLKERMIALIEAKMPEKAKTLDREDDAALETLYREAVAANAPSNEPQAQPQPSPVAAAEMLTAASVDTRIAEAVRLTEARASARVVVAASQLPAPAKTRLEARFAEAAISELETDAVTKAIEAEQTYLAEAAPGGQVSGLGDIGHASLIEGRGEKVTKMFDALFDRTDPSAVSIREAYVRVTGDKAITGRLRECDRVLLREALDSSSLGEVLGDAITRRMIADYRETNILDWWMSLVSVIPVNDFRTQHRIRWGGYGNLPAVEEGAPYTELSSPGDEEETYAPAKRGGTESVTLEAIKNDDMSQLLRIPPKLSRSAKRTVGQFVARFFADNANLADGVALFHATHSNLGSAALDKTSLAAGRLAMVKQTEKDSGEQLGIGPRFLLVPFQLEESAVDLFRRNTENERTFVQSLSLDIIAVTHFTDANDWYLAADPNDIPTIEMGFLDGRTEPELFVQDDPNQGSLFSHDRITYKIRHVYGGTVLDYRGLYKAVVA